MKRKFFEGYNRIATLFWGVLFIIFWTELYRTYLPAWATSVFMISIFIPIIFCSLYLTNRLLPRAVANKNMRIFTFRYFIISLLMAILYYLTVLFFSYLESLGHFPSSDLFNELDVYWREILSLYPSFLLVNLAFCGLRFYYEHSKLQEAHLEAQLQMLQAQVNPHYMFNILNQIHILIRKDVDLASFLLEKYSEILRYQLYNGKKELVPLSQEVQFVKDMVSIERLRWGEDLTVECKWAVEDGSKQIQPLLLIAFIENAFKHVSRSMSDKGYINLVIEQKDKQLYMEIENSKSKYEGEKSNLSSGLGLKNIKERLEILYPNRHTLQIDETDWVYRVELTITLK